MNRAIKGILLGAIAGILDVVPMIIQKLTWDANISAFLMWLVIGFFLTQIKMNIPGFLKGIIVSFLTLAPIAVLIGWQDPFNLLPVSIMTLILGSLLGLAVEKLVKD